MAWVAVGQVGTGVVSTIAVRFITGLLDPAGYGELSLALTGGVLATQVLFGPLSASLLRFFPMAHHRGTVDGLLAARRRMLAVGGVVITALCIFIAAVGSLLHLNYSSGLLVFGGIFAVVNGLEATALGIHSAARRRDIAALGALLSAGARFGGGLVAALTFGQTASIVLAGYCVGTALGAAIEGRLLRRYASGDAGRVGRHEWERQIVRYGWPFAIWGAFYWMQIVSDRWALALFRDTGDAGLYSALYQLGYYPLAQLMAAVGTFIIPIIFSRAGDDEGPSSHGSHTLAKRTTMVIGAVSFIAVVVAAAFRDLIVQVALDGRYSEVAPLLPFVVASAGLFSIGQMATTTTLIDLKSRELIVPSVSSSMLGVVLTCVFAAEWGLAGVVAANCVYSVVFMATMLRVAAKRRVVELSSPF